ncbi:MAG: diiron oxygenase [Oscillatoria sp. SIO1A7]|nr:diiron oxygenase [Oscillatoria sp. SIO1A7]
MTYKGIMSAWSSKATVRSRPPRQLSWNELSEKWLYSPELVTVLNHPLLSGLERHLRQQILAKSLANHLNFTNHLEHGIVNQVVFKLAHNYVIDLPVEMRQDAYRIYVDEAYHSLLVSDIQIQVENATGIKTSNSPPPFYWDIQKLISEVPNELKEKALLCVAIVSETLISKLFEKIPKDTFVVQGVRDVISDHAFDEAYHHQYFKQIFKFVSPQFTEQEKIDLGCLLPKYIYSFLVPDFGFMHSCLIDIGLTRDRATRVINDSYHPANVARDIRTAAAATLRLFYRHGVFDNDRIAAAFAELELLPELTQTCKTLA